MSRTWYGYVRKPKSEPMQKPLSHREFRALVSGHSPRDRFGPHTDYPALVICIAGIGTKYAAWLKDLPCPVIGIGEGALASACDVVLVNEAKLSKIWGNITRGPIAAMTLVQHLRSSEGLSLQDALMVESLAYGTLQTGPEFKAWLAGNEKQGLAISHNAPLEIDIFEGRLSIKLNRPETHNAIGVEMRDALCEALDMALTDSTITEVTLTGRGRVFSTGGAIEEFGEVSDPATAHWVRSLRLPAWRLARLQNKLNIHVNGAAIGAGLEMACFGAMVTASKNAWFQLPELKYGLIPGAGGTASIPRRIGRQRTAYMALSMDKIRAETALDWGLIDAVID